MHGHLDLKKSHFDPRNRVPDVSATKEALQVWKSCGITLWSPIQDIIQTPIPSNQYLLLVAQLVLYTQTHTLCGAGLQELILQNL
jgi:hypothetical protein